MKMDVRIAMEGSKMDATMDKVEDIMCATWFKGDREAYDEWAGHRVTDVMWTFLHNLEADCHIKIELCGDNYFDAVYGA